MTAIGGVARTKALSGTVEPDDLLDESVRPRSNRVSAGRALENRPASSERCS